MNWLFENAGGRKFLLGLISLLVVVISATILALYGAVTGDQALEAIKWAAMVIGPGTAATIALEDRKPKGEESKN